MNTPTLIATDERLQLEAWALFDDDAQLYELFASEACDDYIGNADTLADCTAVAQAWFADRASS